VARTHVDERTSVTLGHPQVLQTQPEDLAAAQATEHHRGDHRPISVGAQRGGQLVELVRG